jgi:enoyl-CoA hydratase
MQPPSGLVLSHQEGVATITIAHSARRNAMTRAMWRSVPLLLSQLPFETRCLVLRGEGEHFCAGGDISEYPSFRFDPDSLRGFHEDEVAPALDALLALDIPVVAMIAGHCMGGGLELAACADIRIAGQSASFGVPIAKLGMPMAPRELAVVARAAGLATACEILLEARVLDAGEMKLRGFLQRIVPDEQLMAHVSESALRIAALSPQAARLNKQALRQIYKEKSAFDHMESARGAIEKIASDPYAYAASQQHREGIEAFLSKRPPQF